MSGEPINVEHDNHLRCAGECFMFLSWVQSTMCDLLALHGLGPERKKRYNAAHRAGASWPSDFSTRRMELSGRNFGSLKDEFLRTWPQWCDPPDVREALERVVIYRNGIAHAQIQPFRDYLLYTPSASSWKKIREYTRCHQCREFHKDCGCDKANQASPPSLIFPFLDSRFLTSLYADVEMVDVNCFAPTAAALGVAYKGIAWPDAHRGYRLARVHGS
ncbi:MAG: hypothetical protein OXU70_09300 [Gammaproteobacteria bacterium]|nr:hypothetical protein [Gammaproteobacteria bacterium]